MDEAERMAERLRLAICDNPISGPEGVFHVTISLGVASAERGIEWTVESIIRAADEALYRAKNRGRNRVECSESAQPSRPSVIPLATMRQSNATSLNIGEANT